MSESGKRARTGGSLRVGVDLGGTSINAVVVDARDDIRGSRCAATGDRDEVDGVLRRVVTTVHDALAVAGARLQDVEIVGIGLPGEVDVAAGELRSSPILPSWRQVAVAARLRELLGVGTLVENDANAALIGEYYLGAGKRARSLLMITVGTGIGGAVMIDGQLWRGSQGSAGEIGHLCLEPDGPACCCGQRGCLGVLGSTSALIARYAQAKGAGPDHGLDGRAVTESFFEGDADAMDCVDAMIDYLSRGIAAAACVLAPHRVVLHGGILAGLAEPLVQGVRKRLVSRHYPAALARIEIAAASLGMIAGAAGAALIAEHAPKTRDTE